MSIGLSAVRRALTSLRTILLAAPANLTPADCDQLFSALDALRRTLTARDPEELGGCNPELEGPEVPLMLTRVWEWAYRALHHELPLFALSRRKEWVELINEAIRAVDAAKLPDQEIVDLDQIASLVKLRKRSMNVYKRRKNDPLPDPDFPGGGGKRDYWRWATVRPWLVRTFPIPIPEILPGIR
jgi:hypothetical protein